MSASTDVEIRLKVSDNASGGLKKASKEAEKTTAKSATATERASAKAAAAAERGAAMQRKSAERTAKAREQLGVRSEKSIQREINRTKAAYERLKASGTMTWREQARAADHMKSKVTQLTNEMGKLTARQKAMGALKTTAAIGAGITAAGYVLAAPANRSMDYDELLAHMSNSAFRDKGKEGKKAGMKEIEAAINNAVKTGGGTREETAEAMQRLIDAKAMSLNDMKSLLSEINKASTVSKASKADLAELANTAVTAYGATPQEVQEMLNMVIAAAEEGKLTAEDMVQSLPRILAEAGKSGMRGKQDFAAILSYMQASAQNTGDNEQAAVNMQALMRTLSDKATLNNIGKLTRTNVPKYLQEQREQGVDQVEAFAGLIDKHLSKKKGYKELQQKMAAAGNDEERQAVLDQMADIAMASGLGEFVGNKKAASSLLAIVNNKEYTKGLRENILADNGTTMQDSYGFLSETTASKRTAAAEDKKMTEKAAMDGLTPIIGKVFDAFSSVANAHPLLVGATTAATSALSAFSPVVYMAMRAMGGGGAIKGIGRGIGRAAGGVASGIGRAAGGITTAGGRIVAARTAGALLPSVMSAGAATSAAGVVAAGAGGYAVGSLINEGINLGMEKATGVKGDSFGSWLARKLHGDEEDKIAADMARPAQKPIADAAVEKVVAEAIAKSAPPQKPVEVDTRLTIGLAPGIVVTNQSAHADGGTARMSTGNIHTGAPR